MPVSGEAPSPVCVVHLVRQSNGTEPLQRFLAAYRRFPGGLEHDLMLLCKGFEGSRLPTSYLAALADLRPRLLFLPDAGFDIAPYFAAARQTQYLVYCFLNSFSEPLDPQWLRRLHVCLQAPGVKLAGATGSWGSMAAIAEWVLGLPSVYDNLLERPSPDALPLSGQPFTLRQRVDAWKRRWQDNRQYQAWRRHFPPFPAWHIRSNAFMLRRETMLGLRCGPIRTKLDAMRFESGRDSMTAQIIAGGGEVRLAGRNGVNYEPVRWPESNAFWQAEQDNLLVADNQTLNYTNADAAQRQFYAHCAWGPHAADRGSKTAKLK